ncbi:hypothetical protein ACQ4PT_060077 [Festuca glaucescens]
MNSGPFSGAAGLYGGFYGGFGGGHGHDHGFSQQLGAPASSLLLNGGPRQLDAAVDSTDVAKRKGGFEREKATTALRSHSEAERRRRERINAHLATLRSMVPSTDKMDKAALLAEVINHVKKLKAEAARIGKHCPIPSGADEVTVVEVVEQSPYPNAMTSHNHHHSGAVLLVKATLSCADGCADLFADVRRALQPLKPRVVGSEVTTLGGRVGLTVLMVREGTVTAASVRQALESVLDRVVNSAAALDFAPRDSLLYSKRRRVSTFESSSSSS